MPCRVALMKSMTEKDYEALNRSWCNSSFRRTCRKELKQEMYSRSSTGR